MNMGTQSNETRNSQLNHKSLGDSARTVDSSKTVATQLRPMQGYQTIVEEEAEHEAHESVELSSERQNSQNRLAQSHKVNESLASGNELDRTSEVIQYHNDAYKDKSRLEIGANRFSTKTGPLQ